jgi:hypothetical protein
MALWMAALWGLLGAGSVEAWELYEAIHRVKNFPWRVADEIPAGPFLLSIVLRLGLGIGLAMVFVASHQAGGPVGAAAVGVAAPKFLEQLARRAISKSPTGIMYKSFPPTIGAAEETSHAP